MSVTNTERLATAGHCERRDWSGLIALACFGFLALAATSCTPIDEDIAETPSAAVGASELAFKFGTFNVQLRPAAAELFTGSQVDEIPERQRMLAEHVSSEGYDIVVFQEAFAARDMHQGLADAGYTVLAAPSESDLSDFVGTNSGLSLATRLPIADLGGIDNDLLGFSYELYGHPGTPDGVVVAASSGDYFDLGSIGAAGVPVPAGNIGATLLAFIEFDECSGADCLADKGVVLAQLEHPGGELLTIVVTHLQADGDMSPTSDEVADRKDQMADIDRILRQVLGDDPAAWGHVILAGDFNLRGDRDAEDDPSTPGRNEGRFEWDEHLSSTADPAASFLRRSLPDVWERDAFPSWWLADDPTLSPEAWVERTDIGHSHGPYVVGTDRTRLDFVLANESSIPQSTALCWLHPRKDLDAVVPPVGGLEKWHNAYLSDHWMLVSEVTNWAEFCSPAAALVVEPMAFIAGADGETQILDASNNPGIGLSFDSAAQWFLVTEPGAYAIAARVAGTDGVFRDDGVVDFDIYRTTNLSTPVLPWSGGPAVFVPSGEDVPIETPVFTVHDKPFFIKVQQTDRDDPDQAGRTDYQLVIHRLNGSQPQSAIPLNPAEPDPPAGTIRAVPSVPAPLRWYTLVTVGPFDPQAAQRIQFFATDPATGIAPTVTLYERDASSVIAQGQGFLELEQPDLNWRRLYVSIAAGAGADLVDPHLEWRTNLTVLPVTFRDDNQDGLAEAHAAKDDTNLLTLVAIEQTDWLGDDDDVKLQLFIDGRAAYPTGSGVDTRLDLGDFDTGEARPIASRVGCSIGFLTGIDIELEEDDGFLTFGNDILNGTAPITPLDERRIVDPGGREIKGDGGHYRLLFETVHYSPDGRSWEIGSGLAPPSCRGS